MGVVSRRQQRSAARMCRIKDQASAAWNALTWMRCYSALDPFRQGLKRLNIVGQNVFDGREVQGRILIGVAMGSVLDFVQPMQRGATLCDYIRAVHPRGNSTRVVLCSCGTGNQCKFGASASKLFAYSPRSRIRLYRGKSLRSDCGRTLSSEKIRSTSAWASFAKRCEMPANRLSERFPGAAT